MNRVPNLLVRFGCVYVYVCACLDLQSRLWADWDHMSSEQILNAILWALVTSTLLAIYLWKLFRSYYRSKYCEQAHRRGSSHLVAGEFDEAIPYFDEAIRIDPKNAHAYFGRGYAWYKKKEYDSAIADFNNALEIDPRMAYAYNGRAAVWCDRQDYDKAIANYNEAIRIEPNDAIAYGNRAQVWCCLQDFDRAIADCNLAVRHGPKDAAVFAHRGYVWYRLKDYDKAIADLDEAIQIDPRMAYTYTVRAAIWREKQDFDKAIANYSEALRIDPMDVDSFGNRAFAYAKQKKFAEAMADCEEALSLNARDWVHGTYAWYLATCPDERFRNGAEAVKHAEKGIELAGPNITWHYYGTLAAACAESSDFERAISEQQKALADSSMPADERTKAEARLELYKQKQPYRETEE